MDFQFLQDYQVELQQLQKQLEQEHIVNWLEDAVIKSITPQQVSVQESSVHSNLRVKYQMTQETPLLKNFLNQEIDLLAILKKNLNRTILCYVL